MLFKIPRKKKLSFSALRNLFLTTLAINLLDVYEKKKTKPNPNTLMAIVQLLVLFVFFLFLKQIAFYFIEYFTWPAIKRKP